MINWTLIFLITLNVYIIGHDIVKKIKDKIKEKDSFEKDPFKRLSTQNPDIFRNVGK